MHNSVVRDDFLSVREWDLSAYWPATEQGHSRGGCWGHGPQSSNDWIFNEKKLALLGRRARGGFMLGQGEPCPQIFGYSSSTVWGRLNINFLAASVPPPQCKMLATRLQLNATSTGRMKIKVNMCDDKLSRVRQLLCGRGRCTLVDFV